MVSSGALALAAALGAQAPQALFVEITEEAGLDFRHDPGAEGRFLMPEIMGSGGALFDYDGDGLLDIYLIQAGPDPEAPAPDRPTNRLYRQHEGGVFHDATAGSGLGDPGYGMGVAVGDLDNDGDLDVQVTNYGEDALYRNDGPQGFADISAAAGIRGSLWSSSAVFCDYDGDGWLDLFVARYVAFDPERRCTRDDGSPDYCDPAVFPGVSDALYRNRGDGTFDDVSLESGLLAEAAPGLGVVCWDFNGDHRPDFFVANDGAANHLWMNRGDGRLVEEGIVQGVAFNEMGHAEAGMGIAFGDSDGDSDLDLFVTNLTSETNTLYGYEGAFGFQDVTARAGLAAGGLRWTGFGAGFFDFDHDGDLDLAVVNGRVQRHPALPGADLGEFWSAYAEPNLLFENDGSGRFTGVEAAFASRLEISRGLSFGDLDQDGDLDLLLTHTAGPARLFRNESPKKGHWLSVRAFDPAAKRDAHGALVTVVAGGNRYRRAVGAGGSYLSASDSRIHFGFPEPGVERITVRWPDGSRESFPGLEADLAIVLRKGGGEPDAGGRER